MICGIVDLGSNSIRMSIYNYENGMTRMLLNKKTTAGLSGYVVEKELTERGIRKACQVLGNYKNILTDFGIGNAYIFATASLRNIANTEEAVKRIEDEMGLYVDVLSGEEEARLGFMGATLAVNIEKGLFIDIGGGSTELVTFRKREILKATSMPVGSLNLFLRHTAALLPTDGSMKKIKQDVLSEMGKTDLFQKGKQNVICGIGGTVRAARKLYNELYSLPCDNATMETENLSRMLAFYKENGRDFSRKILEIAPDRIHTIIPGMIILNTIAKKSRSENIIVSQCGVREGYLFDKVLRI